MNYAIRVLNEIIVSGTFFYMAYSVMKTLGMLLKNSPVSTGNMWIIVAFSLIMAATLIESINVFRWYFLVGEYTPIYIMLPYMAQKSCILTAYIIGTSYIMKSMKSAAINNKKI